MDFNTIQKYSLIFTSESIYYPCNSEKGLSSIIQKMMHLLVDNSVLLIEYIHKSENTDNNRLFVDREEMLRVINNIDNTNIISHKVKKYVEKGNPMDNKTHEIMFLGGGESLCTKKKLNM